MLNTLTQRESEVIHYIGRGWGNRDIAKKMGIKVSSLQSTYIESIYSKLYLRNRTQLALYALKSGITSIDQVNVGRLYRIEEVFQP